MPSVALDRIVLTAPSRLSSRRSSRGAAGQARVPDWLVLRYPIRLEPLREGLAHLWYFDGRIS